MENSQSHRFEDGLGMKLYQAAELYVLVIKAPGDTGCV